MDKREIPLPVYDAAGNRISRQWSSRGIVEFRAAEKPEEKEKEEPAIMKEGEEIALFPNPTRASDGRDSRIYVASTGRNPPL